MVAASLLLALPIVSTSGWYPDFGYLFLLAWRLLRADPWPPWWAAPLGFVNDLFTGNPVGFSIALWSATMLALDLIDRRTMWRDYWIEWGLAALFLALNEWLQWRLAAVVGARPDFRHGSAPPRLDLHVPARRLAGRAHRPLEARSMKHMRITTAHQSITFSRRMMLLGGAQAAVGGLLIGRMGWLSIAQNRKYQLLSESNRVQLIPVPPRRGWIIDRQGKPIAINRSSFRVDIIPQQLEDGPRVVSAVADLLQLPADEVERINSELVSSRGFQPVSVADNVPYEKYAAITVRMPELPGVAASRGFTRYYPAGSTVGQLVGYVGAASAKEYEAEDKNPLLLIPGVKIGKEGLEKTLEPTLRGTPGGQRVEVTARGKLVKELDPKPDRSGGTVQITIDADLHEYAARRIGDQSGSIVVLDVHTGDILAMPSMPSFDPNTFSDGISTNEWKMLSEDDHLPLVDKVLEALYPSGSTIKPLMALALLKAGVDPKRIVVCNRTYPVGNHIFHCDQRHGPVNLEDAVVRSCDRTSPAAAARPPPRTPPCMPAPSGSRSARCSWSPLHATWTPHTSPLRKPKPGVPAIRTSVAS